MYAKSSHPFDVEISGYVVGVLDDRASAAIAEHLNECLLCRIRDARIRRPTPSRGSSTVAHAAVDVSSAAEVVVSGNAEREGIVAGQVWRADDGLRETLVWIRTVLDGVVVCHPATMDVEVADDSTLIVEDVELLDRPLAVMASIVGTVPIDRLTTCVGVLDIAADVNRLRDTSLAGARAELGWPTGPPLTGPADKRLVLQQLLADDLAALDPIIEDNDAAGLTEDDLLLSGLINALRTDVADRRGSACQLSLIANSDVNDYADAVGCTAVARLQDLDCSVLVVTGVNLADWALTHHSETTHLLRLADAYALAVAEPVDPFDTCVFEPRDLASAYELPDAGDRSDPRVGRPPRPVAKALYDFFEDSAFRGEPANSFPTPGARRELGELLSRHAAEAIDRLRATRAQLSKREALQGLSVADGIGLASALESAENLETLVAALDRIAKS